MSLVASGDAIVALARQHVGEKYQLGARAPMANPGWKGPWDCAEFASWCVYQTCGVLFGVEPRTSPILADAYTGYWAEQARAAGALIPVAQAASIAGAMLLRIPRPRGTGHIVISDGHGGTVEAHSTKLGVIQGRASGRHWDYGVLLPGVACFSQLDTVALAPPPSTLLRLCQPMLRGELVHKLQAALTRLGFHPGALDGVYGPQTASAVEAFQQAEGLLVDGEAGPDTFAALQAKGCLLH